LIELDTTSLKGNFHLKPAESDASILVVQLTNASH